jgi:uncharacterized repeat protein (TIGR01451 family)
LKLTGPRQRNVNQATEYTLTVTNPGTAAATQVLVTADIPQQLHFDAASDDGRFYKGRVAWVLETLPAGQVRTLTMQLRAKVAGEFCILGEAAAKDSRSGEELDKVRAELCTVFQGEAGLHLEIIDRSDPIEIGGATSYPIRVLNQGHVPTTNVRIRAFIPDGMVLMRATGPTDNRTQDARTPDGRVVLEFDPLASLPPGEERLYEIYVQPRREGDYRFRAQLTADQLIAGPVTEEESTTVFREDPLPPRPGPNQF